MDHKQELEVMHKQSLQKFEDYLKAKEHLPKEEHEKLHGLKNDWKVAWNKLMETLVILERIEI